MSKSMIDELPVESHKMVELEARLERIELILSHFQNLPIALPAQTHPNLSIKDTIASVADDTPLAIRWPSRRLPLDSPTQKIPQESLLLQTPVFLKPPVDSPIRVTPDAETPPKARGTAHADLLGVLPEPVVIVDSEGQIRVWSKAAQDFFGWSEEQVLGQTLPFLPVDSLTAFQRLLAQTRNGVRVRGMSLPLQHASGQVQNCLISAGLDTDGNTVLILRSAAPEKKKTEAAEPEPQILTSMDVVGKLTAGLVHDFNNVLSAIHGSAQIIAEKVTSGNLYEAADVILSATRHASGLTSRILELVTRKPGIPEAIEVGTVLVGLDRLVRAVAGGIKCVITPGAGVPSVLIDRTELEQIVLNLVANARDAMPEGGVLGIRSSNADVRSNRPGWPSHMPLGDYVCLTVIDTGKGIDDRDRARIGELFYTTKPTGTGLGLSIVKGIIQRAGGHLEIDSIVGRGSVFRVYLPVAPESTRTPEIGRTVMLVDDDESIRELAKVALERIGFSVQESYAGDDAWRMARACPGSIDLLVTDIVLPGLNGRTLADRLRNLRPNLPVVFISGYPQTNQTLPKNAAFLSKPFRAQDLVAAVQKARQSQEIV